MAPIELPQTLPEAHDLIRQLLDRLEKLEALVETQQRRIDDLERQLRQSSRNSSRPPSSDGPGAPSRPPTPPSGRSRGGQPGHRGRRRELFGPERIDEVRDVWPSACESCGLPIEASAAEAVGDARVHQVAEVPPIRAHVTEYRMHAVCCRHCATTTRAALPEGVASSQFGPRLHATIGLLSSTYRLGQRPLQRLLRELFGVEISLGAIVDCQQRVSAAIEAPYVELAAFMAEQPVLNADETSWAECNEKAWLWAAVAAEATLFMIDPKRSREAAQRLLGSFEGVLGTDRWCAYGAHDLKRRQLCWAHLIRHFREFAEYAGEAAELGRALLSVTERLFAIWHLACREGWPLAQARRKTTGVRAALRSLFAEGARSGIPRVEATCRDLVKSDAALWTFLHVPGVEPTNNAAERALRPAVIKRKLSFGTQSDAGSRFVERIFSAAATLRQQGRDFLDYLVTAVAAHFRGHAAPPLTPAR